MLFMVLECLAKIDIYLTTFHQFIEFSSICINNKYIKFPKIIRCSYLLQSNKNVFDRITLKYSFSFCPEITTKLTKINEKILEVPISYNGRSYKDGKK